MVCFVGEADEAPMREFRFRDVLCDACLCKVESASYVVDDDLCNRCRKKLTDWWADLQSSDKWKKHSGLLEERKP
jgi:hypothetical protein